MHDGNACVGCTDAIRGVEREGGTNKLQEEKARIIERSRHPLS